MRRALLEIDGLEKSFGGGAPVVAGFDLDVLEGEFVSLLGHSGCGKSTVLAMVAGLTESSGGAIVLARREVTGPGPDRGVVFQAPCLLPWLSARENVALGLPSESAIRAHRYLERVGLGEEADRRPGELSVGMCQRVALARAWAREPKLLLLDEPFGMLDSITRVEMQLLLVELGQEEARTTLMVTHDVDEALFLSDRIALMTRGPAARVGQIVDVPFARPRTREGVTAHPEYRHLRERLLRFLEDDVPALMAV